MKLNITYDDEGKFFFTKNDEPIIEIPNLILKPSNKNLKITR